MSFTARIKGDERKKIGDTKWQKRRRTDEKKIIQRRTRHGRTEEKEREVKKQKKVQTKKNTKNVKQKSKKRKLEKV